VEFVTIFNDPVLIRHIPKCGNIGQGSA
jgi:hypothetical protein